MTLKETVQWLEKTDGRDRLSKIIQYLSLLVQYIAKKRRWTALEDRFMSLYSITLLRFLLLLLSM